MGTKYGVNIGVITVVFQPIVRSLECVMHYAPTCSTEGVFAGLVLHVQTVRSVKQLDRPGVSWPPVHCHRRAASPVFAYKPCSQMMLLSKFTSQLFQPDIGRNHTDFISFHDVGDFSIALFIQNLFKGVKPQWGGRKFGFTCPRTHF